MTDAGTGLLAAVAELLRGIDGLGVHDESPVQAAAPYAAIGVGAESDWGHKSGAGREVRLAVTLRDRGERPTRLRALTGEVEAAVAGFDGPVDGWQLVSLVWLRSRTAAPRDGAPNGEWTAVIEFRARLLAD